MLAQTMPFSLHLLQWAITASWIFLLAAAALPLFICLALVLARRTHAHLCLRGTKELVQLHTLWLCLTPLACIGDVVLFLCQLALLGHPFTLPDPFAPALRGPLVALLLLVTALLLRLLWPKQTPDQTKDTLSWKELFRPLTLALLLLILCFGALLALSFPFAGLPEGLTLGQALFALISASEHKIFFGLFPASLLILLSLPKLKAQLKGVLTDNADTVLAIRSVCALGAIGALPHMLSSFGTIAGYFLRRETPQAIHVLLAQEGCFLCALLLLLLLWAKKKYTETRQLHLLALFFFILGASLPALLMGGRAF